MGLLDDAIREHLELKRQRGADQDEVSRLEREALGPVVRGDEFVPDAASAGDESLPPEYEPLDAHEAAAEYDHPASDAEPALEYEPLAPEAHPVEPEPYQPEVGQHVGQPTEEFDVESAHAQEALRSTPPEPPPASHEPPPPAPDPPAPADAHDHHDAHEPPKTGEHDVLEDTPEFLQETPEHDRLWFEQGPPQEFDFDK